MLIRGAGEPTPLTLHQIVLMSLCSSAVGLIYYGLLEGLWGASVGKRICRLRVARLDRTVPGVWRALLRTFIITTVPSAMWLLGRIVGDAWMSGPSLGSWITVFSFLSLTMSALMFATARRRNGFAGLHDFASGTRVIVQSAYLIRPALPLASEALPTTESLPLVGPYHVLDRLGSEDGAELLLGFDDRLLRRVWIRRLPLGTPSIATHLRHLGRPGRLRWLTVQRTDTEAWDAYEAVPGQPLLALLAEPQAWGRVRFWLLDLAEELHAAALDGSLPTALGLDRVWITADGRAKLLDFPAPGTASLGASSPTPADSRATTPQSFLRQVAISALEGCPSDFNETNATGARVPLAFHASRFLETLRADANLNERIADLRSLLSLPAEVSRARRAALLADALVPPLLAILVGGQVQLFTRAFDSARRKAGELNALRWYLTQHRELQRQTQSGRSDARADLESLETYLAGRFASLITNAPRRDGAGPRTDPAGSVRAELAQVLTHTAAPSAEQFAAASARVDQVFLNAPKPAASETRKLFLVPMALAVAGYVNTVYFVILPCLLGSLLFRGGALVKLLGIVFVNRRSPLASRWRVSLRNLLAWLPFLLLPGGVKLLTPMLEPMGAALALTGLIAGLALMSVFLPQRGLADRLAGTWPVPEGQWGQASTINNWLDQQPSPEPCA